MEVGLGDLRRAHWDHAGKLPLWLKPPGVCVGGERGGSKGPERNGNRNSIGEGGVLNWGVHALLMGAVRTWC